MRRLDTLAAGLLWLSYERLTTSRVELMDKTRLSSKGQIIIPRKVRDAHGWRPGIEFTVEDTGDAIILTPVKHFSPTRIEDVLGCAGYQGPRASLDDMEAAIQKGVRSREW